MKINCDTIRYFTIRYIIFFLSAIGMIYGISLITNISLIKFYGCGVILSSLYWLFAFLIALE